MRDLSKPFGIVSVFFLIILAISPVKEHFREWRLFQREYNELIQTLPQRVSPVREGLQQIWVPELDVIDRCTTCHLGMNIPALKEASQPYKTHPPMDHQPDRFGCTPCHQGQGLATSVETSFGFVENWEKPILTAPFIESSCGMCHSEKRVPHAPLLNEGKELIKQYSCSGCHNINGFDKSFIPALDGLSSKVSRDWLIRWLKNPIEVSPNTKMPDFQLTDEEVKLLADFLLYSKMSLGEKELDPLPKILIGEIPESLYEPGETLFRTARCISCHSVEGKGGTVAVELSTVASKANTKWIYNYIKNPRKLQPDVPMPQYNFSEEELQAITAYIIEEFIDWDLPDKTEEKKYMSEPANLEKGLAVFQKYNCGGCHALGDLLMVEEFGPSLSIMRNKPFYQLEFGQKDIPHTKERYIIEKLKDPRGFLDNAVMPEYQFNDREIIAITAVLLSLQEQSVPEKYRVIEESTPSITFQGEFGQLLDKYQCLTCHTIFNQGGTIAPNLTQAGSELNEKWIKEYFELPYTLRPIMTERMPNFFMDDDEIGIMTRFISSVLRNDEIENDMDLSFDDALIEQGKRLYYNSYSCQACHQIEGEGGYVGPPLDGLSKRLKPAWIFNRLKNPHKYNPGIPEPNFNLSEEEAGAITAFLLSEKEKK